MQLLKLVMMAILLLGSSALFAHKGHIVPPSSDWLHLLAHYWPVGSLGIVIWGIRRHLYRSSNSHVSAPRTMKDDKG